MTTEAPDLELERLPHELKRAIDAGGETMTEMLDPGSLTVRYAGDHLDVFADDRLVGQIPKYRLAPIDGDLLQAAVEMFTQAAPPELVAELDRGTIRTAAPPDADLVTVLVDGLPFCVLHRSRVVPGWPNPPELSHP